MKLIPIILLTTICLTSFKNADYSSISSCSQQQDIFTGNWKYQSGNEIFIINLWKTTDGYKGHYKKIIVDANNNEVSVIFNSNKPVGSSNSNWPFVLYSLDFSNQNYKIGGPLSDNTVANSPYRGGFVPDSWEMKIINPECYTIPIVNCQLQAIFSRKKTPGLTSENEPDFSIPTDIILTKE